jgi:hypothetical protein
VACPTGACSGGLTCANGVCWDAAICGGDTGEGGDDGGDDGGGGQTCTQVCTQYNQSSYPPTCVKYETVCK